MDHVVKVLEDGTLEAGRGWVLVKCKDTGALYFLVEESAAVDAETLTDAWAAARRLEGLPDGGTRLLKRVV